MDISSSLTKAQFSNVQKPDEITVSKVKTFSEAQAQKAAEDVEAFFLSQVFETMFAGVKTDGPFGGGQGEKVFRSMLVQEYGKASAKAGGFGLADEVQREILSLQEAQK